jgi:hypothetical protein
MSPNKGLSSTEYAGPRQRLDRERRRPSTGAGGAPEDGSLGGWLNTFVRGLAAAALWWAPPPRIPAGSASLDGSQSPRRMPARRSPPPASHTTPRGGHRDLRRRPPQGHPVDLCDRPPRSDAGAGRVPNDPAGHRALSAWAHQHAPAERSFGIEGSGSYGYVPARALVGASETVVEVPPSLADREGRRGRRGTSDALDALAIARVAAREELSVIRGDPLALDLKLASDYRAQLKA